MIPRIYEPSETDFETNGLGVLKQCTRCHVYEGANGKYELELDHPTNTRFDEYFDNDYQIKAKPNDMDEYHIFTIYNKGIDTYTDQVTVYAQSRTYKLGKRVVTKATVDSATGQEAMNVIEANMDMESDVKLYSDITTVSSTTFEARNVLNCIAGEQGSLLQYWGGEIKREPFKLSLLKRRGRDNVGTVRYGKDLSGLKVTLDWQSLLTRIIPYADVQNAEGVAERIYGDQVDSELIDNYPDVSTDFVQFTEEQGVKDLKSLNNKAKNYFKSINPGCDKPKINIEIQFEKLTDTEEAKEFARIRNYGLFDTFTVYHKRYKINLTSKVGGVKYDSLTEKTLTLEAGDGQTSFYQKQENMVTEQLKSYSSVNYMSQFADYVSSMITGGGQAGGHVVLWPKEQPSNILIMDTADINTAKQVIRLNKNGIAFSKDGWNGPFNSAWTIDSVFNADFIRTGKIIADVFETSFNALGDQLKLAAGALQAWNNGKKIMEMTKKGMEFWNGNKAIGTIGTAGNPFPQLVIGSDSNGNPVYADMDGKALQLVLDSDSDFLTLASSTGHGLILGKNRGMYIIDDNIRLIGKTQISGDMNIMGKLTINGQQVYPGQGGGPDNPGDWNGNYPPGVTSSADKFAWELWVYLLSKGYSKASISGILGNVQGEVGAGMNPDTAQVGGPAYGIVQWDGSAYPLVGPATYDGRTYVTNLFNAAGITEAISSMSGQAKLLDWCMFNGQWLGRVSPTSVSGFKTMTDPQAAAYTFEENFERPAAAHPERQGYAQNWYNKFKDLEVTQPNNDIVSIARSWLGWFYYVQLHPSSDLGNLNNPNKSGGTDCSGFVWLVLNKAGYRVPNNMQWYTGSMTSDARGSRNWLTEISESQSRAGDIIIYNLGSGAGNNGHTAILLEPYKGNNTQIIEMGGDSRYTGVNISTIGYAFGSLLSGDRCLARGVK